MPRVKRSEEIEPDCTGCGQEQSSCQPSYRRVVAALNGAIMRDRGIPPAEVRRATGLGKATLERYMKPSEGPARWPAQERIEDALTTLTEERGGRSYLRRPGGRGQELKSLDPRIYLTNLELITRASGTTLSGALVTAQHLALGASPEELMQPGHLTSRVEKIA